MSLFDDIRGKLLLAPLASVGDPIFRRLCLDQGAALTYTEMVSAKGLSYDNDATWDLVVPAPGEERLCVQLFGHEPSVMAEQAKRVQDKWGSRLALIDVNMGCPVPKVVKRGEGGALMKTPELAAEIVRALVSSVDVPVTAKFRRGWESGSMTCVDFAKRMEDAGAAWLCVHGRSVSQVYHGPSDNMPIAAVKEAVSIPVVGNGDLHSREDCVRMHDETGCDAFMIARGALGNPWIFSERADKPSTDERLDMLLAHVRGLFDLDPVHGIPRTRKHICWYVSGMRGASVIREAAMRATTLTEIEGIVEQARTMVRQEGDA